jgi:hypothetical protein
MKVRTLLKKTFLKKDIFEKKHNNKKSCKINEEDFLKILNAHLKMLVEIR